MTILNIVLMNQFFFHWHYTTTVTIVTMMRSGIRNPHLTPDTSEVPDTRAVTRRVITDLTAAVKREIARN